MINHLIQKPWFSQVQFYITTAIKACVGMSLKSLPPSFLYALKKGLTVPAEPPRGGGGKPYNAEPLRSWDPFYFNRTREPIVIQILPPLLVPEI